MSTHYKNIEELIFSYENFVESEIEYEMEYDTPMLTQSNNYLNKKKKLSMKNVFIDSSIKKIKFCKETVENLKFASITKFLKFENSRDAYLMSYSDMNFYTYCFFKMHGFYPDIIRIEHTQTDKFISELFKYAKIPLDCYHKSFYYNRGNVNIINGIFGIDVKGYDDNLYFYVDNDEIVILFNKKYEKDIESPFHLLIGLAKGCIEPKLSKNKIYVVYQSRDGFEKTGFNVKKINVNLDENYNNDFPKIAEEIIKGLNDKNKSNLVILNGLPGTGKTTFIRYLTSKIKKNIIFISPDMVSQITDPAFIPFLIKNNNVVLIIEDAEPALQSRAGGVRSGAVSNILNLTDGLLSDCLNISIVATFNTVGQDIDAALLRKGRLLKNYKFDKLSIEKSKVLLKKLGHKKVEVKNPMTLAEIYFYENNTNSGEYVHKKIGFKN